MPRRYVVSKLAKKSPTLPKEVTPVAPRAYRDRWGTEYDVVWNGLPADVSLIGNYDRIPSS
jgi:hypothetical protein